MFMVLSSWPKGIARVHPVYVMNVDCAPGGQMLQMPVDLGCESAENWQLSSTSTIAILIITQPVGWYSFYRPTKGGRLSRPKHCSKGAQPVLKTVYRSSRRDKHKCQRRDLNLDPLIPQSDVLTTRPLRPCCAYHVGMPMVLVLSVVQAYRQDCETFATVTKMLIKLVSFGRWFA